MATNEFKVRVENTRRIDDNEARDMAEKDTQRQHVAKGVGGVLDAELDALLDEIDDVLEENAEIFVQQFIQKGGE